MSEEEAPASAYLRALPKSVAEFVYTERGKSTKDTVNSMAITAHMHTHTITHIYMHPHMHRCTHTMVIQHFASLQLQIWKQKIMHKHHLPSFIKTNVEQHFYVAFFFLFSLSDRRYAPRVFPVCIVLELITNSIQ